VYHRIRHVPRCASDDSEYFSLKSFKNINVGVRRRSPQLDSIGPDGFQDRLVEEEEECFQETVVIFVQ